MDRLPPLPVKEKLLTTAEAGKILGVSTDTVLDWFNAGEFPGAYKLNPTRRNSPIRIPHSAVQAKLQQRQAAYKG